MTPVVTLAWFKAELGGLVHLLIFVLPKLAESATAILDGTHLLGHLVVV